MISQTAFFLATILCLLITSFPSNCNAAHEGRYLYVELTAKDGRKVHAVPFSPGPDISILTAAGKTFTLSIDLLDDASANYILEQNKILEYREFLYKEMGTFYLDLISLPGSYETYKNYTDGRLQFNCYSPLVPKNLVSEFSTSLHFDENRKLSHEDKEERRFYVKNLQGVKTFTRDNHTYRQYICYFMNPYDSGVISKLIKQAHMKNFNAIITMLEHGKKDIKEGAPETQDIFYDPKLFRKDHTGGTHVDHDELIRFR